jgi:hypothetical protein
MRSGMVFRALALILFLAAPSAAQAQFADDWGYSQGDGYYRGDSETKPLDRILPQIRRSHPGQFYDAEGPFIGTDGQAHYRVKWMTPEGRVVWFDADARTGRVLSTESGRRGYEFTPEGRPREFGAYPEGPRPGGPGPGPARNWGGGRNWDGGRNWGGRSWGGGFWGGGGRNRGH